MTHTALRSSLLCATAALAASCGGKAAAPACPATPAASDLTPVAPADFDQPVEGFTLTSADLADGSFREDAVLNAFGCSGGNVSPALAWSGAPAGTESFALTVFDPDAPTGSGFWHWTVFDLPADTTGLPSGAGSKDGALPAGAIQGLTDLAAPGYAGPCPPPGAPHRYVFTLFALSVPTMGLDAAHTTPAILRFSLHGKVLGTAKLVATYGR